MCAASPARNSRPYCIGSTTKLRMPVTPFSRIGPSSSVQPSSADAQLELLPDPLVRPLARGPRPARTGGSSATELRRAQAEQREAALVVRVDELVDRRRDLRRGCRASRTGTRARTSREHAVRDARPADAVEAVAAGDHVALELVPLALVAEADRAAARSRGRATRDVVDLEQQRQPALEPRGDQVLDDLGLAVDDDRAPPVSSSSGDPVALAVELELDPVVDDPLAVHPLADAGLARAGRRSPARARRRGSAPRRTRGCGPRARPTRSPRARAAGRASARPARRRRCRPACASRHAVLVEHALRDRERRVRRRDAAVDRRLEQHLLDLVRRQAVAAARRARACASSSSRPSATSAVSVMQLRVLPVEARAAPRSRPRRSA